MRATDMRAPASGRSIARTNRMNTNVSTVAADLIDRMLAGRAWGMAFEALVDHAPSLAPPELLQLVHATCASYDAFQLNADDESTYRRREFVEELASLLRASPTPGVFVVPETALAFAFHPASRRAFVALACRAPANLDAIFADCSFAVLAANDSRTYQPTGAVRHMLLRDAYWGRDSEEHVAAFLAAKLPPYFAGWHSAEYLQVRFHSLALGTPTGRPLVTCAAEAARRGLLQASNVNICGKFFEPDPETSERPNLRDSLAVARTLRLERFLVPRGCAHFGVAAIVSTPVGRVEHLCAAEMLICTLEPLRLPAYALLWIVQQLVHVQGPYVALFLRNVERVYATTASLRGSSRKRVEPAAPAAPNACI
jgi:hypothetical protein